MTKAFNYFEASPQHWAERLQAFKEQGITVVQLPCLWGVHEQTKGIRDFSRSPKVRLEKIFSEAKRNDLKLELLFGFPPNALAFPKWVLGEKTSGLIPAILWNEQDRGYEFHTIPSFVSEEFQLGFLEFLDEALSLIALYAGEGGPVAKVSVNLGVLGSDLSLLTTPPYLELFQEKYKTAEVLNDRFSTNYRSIPLNHPDQLFRSLFERRPWLTAYDYRLFRKQLLDRFKTRIKTLTAFKQLAEHVSLAESAIPRIDGFDRAIVIDSTFVDLSSQTVAPFFPDRAVNPMSAFAYRVVEFCDRFAKRSNFGLLGISEAKLSEEISFPYLVGVSGKYMSSYAIELIERCASEGASVFFPFGFPLYREDGSETAWSKLGQREMVKDKKKPLFRIPLGKGGLFSPVGSLPMDESLAKSLNEFEEIIRGN